MKKIYHCFLICYAQANFFFSLIFFLILILNYGWVDVTCCKWTQELIDSVWSRILPWYDIVYQKGVFISEGMERIQSLTSGEKRPQWPFSAFTKLNWKKITIYSIQLLENRYCISANKRSAPGTYLILRLWSAALKRGRCFFQSKRNYWSNFFIFVYLFHMRFILVTVTLWSDF